MLDVWKSAKLLLKKICWLEIPCKSACKFPVKRSQNKFGELLLHSHSQGLPAEDLKNLSVFGDRVN